MSADPVLTPMPWLVRISVALHGLALPALWLWPTAWGWVLLGLVLDHAVITATGLWPRSTWLGPNIRRLPAAAAARGEVALTFDDGPDPTLTPQVLALLQRHGAKATFFVIAERALAQPALVAAIVAQGHSVQNHSHRHRHNFSLLGPRGFTTELQRSQDALTRLAGEAPRYFRAPAGLRNPFLQPVLARLGLTLTSWTRRGFDTREARAERVLARLTRGLAAGDILLLHDGHCAHDAQGRPVTLQVLPPLLQQLQRAGLRCVTLPEAFAATAPAAQAPAAHPALRRALP